MQKFVLYADDDIDDRNWVTEACNAIATDLLLHFVENGSEVFAYLDPLSPEQFPALIILDLNMPQLDGRQTLQRLKTHPKYRHIPVAIVSTSSSKIDQDVCHRLGAAIFLVKPHSHKNWQAVIQQLVPLTRL